MRADANSGKRKALLFKKRFYNSKICHFEYFLSRYKKGSYFMSKNTRHRHVADSCTKIKVDLRFQSVVERYCCCRWFGTGVTVRNLQLVMPMSLQVSEAWSAKGPARKRKAKCSARRRRFHSGDTCGYREAGKRLFQNGPKAYFAARLQKLLASLLVITLRC